MNRRSLLTSVIFAFGTRRLLPPCYIGPAQADERSWHHGVALFGDFKYPSGFKQFDYVNPNAPQGGTVRQIALGTYDNFNIVVDGVKGALAQGIDLNYDTLMVPALDELSSEYGLLAEAVSYANDFSSMSFRLRSQAKWHDGSPVTTEDVLFSFNTFKKLSPQAAAEYQHVLKAEKTGDSEVTFTFDSVGQHRVRVGRLAILPKAWWEGTDSAGKKRDIGSTTLEPPLGSGAYRIKDFSPGRSIVYERVKDYWGANVNVNIGRNNFEELQFEYFRDSTAAMEAFKADAADWRIENSAKNWATGYDFPAVADKRVVLEEFPINNVGIMQAFAFNIRREKFDDPRVRRAFNCAFDFEKMNEQIFFGQYKRIASYFEGTEFAATGLPSSHELLLLESIRDKVPPEVFNKAYSNPVNGSPGEVRTNLREAMRLLKQAGYEVRNQGLVDSKTGEPLTVEFLSNSLTFERVFLFFKPSLERLGITVAVRTVDEAQYENRLRSWDFDIITFAWRESQVPGSELRDNWGSAAAVEAGSNNVVGIKNPAIDAMIEHVFIAKSYEDLVAAARALDRVLLWNHYVVPQWSYNNLRTARWDRFGHPDQMPKYGGAAFPAVWWWDAAKAKATKHS